MTNHSEEIDNILDYNDDRKQKRNIFSIISFVAAITIIFIFLYVAWIFTGIISAAESIEPPNPYLIYVLYAALLIGVVSAIGSIVKKEKNNLFKWVGILINFGVALFITAALVFSYL